MLKGIAMSASRLRTRLQYFLRDARGVSAIEFALLAPLMITLYLGGVEVSQAVNIDRKVSLTARTIADLVTRVTAVSTADMNNIFDAGTAVAAPYPSSKLKIKISSLYVDNNNVVKVQWGRAKNTTARSNGDVISTLPAALKIKDTNLIWAEVEYEYTPTMGYVLTGTFNLKDQIYMRPRLSDKVIGPT